jgi:hypothetical protein
MFRHAVQDRARNRNVGRLLGYRYVGSHVTEGVIVDVDMITGGVQVTERRKHAGLR